MLLLQRQAMQPLVNVPQPCLVKLPASVATEMMEQACLQHAGLPKTIDREWRAERHPSAASSATLSASGGDGCGNRGCSSPTGLAFACRWIISSLRLHRSPRQQPRRRRRLPPLLLPAAACTTPHQSIKAPSQPMTSPSPPPELDGLGGGGRPGLLPVGGARQAARRRAAAGAGAGASHAWAAGVLSLWEGSLRCLCAVPVPLPGAVLVNHPRRQLVWSTAGKEVGRGGGGSCGVQAGVATNSLAPLC